MYIHRGTHIQGVSDNLPHSCTPELASTQSHSNEDLLKSCLLNSYSVLKRSAFDIQPLHVEYQSIDYLDTVAVADPEVNQRGG